MDVSALTSGVGLHELLEDLRHGPTSRVHAVCAVDGLLSKGSLTRIRLAFVHVHGGGARLISQPIHICTTAVSPAARSSFCDESLASFLPI